MQILVFIVLGFFAAVGVIATAVVLACLLDDGKYHNPEFPLQDEEEYE